MKALRYLLLVLLPALANAQYDSIRFEGSYRTYLLHLPAGIDTGSENLPLVIAMHGGFGNAYNLENQSQLSAKADEANFIVVYPEGVESALNIRTWNAGWCCGYASQTNVDDTGFISALLDTLLSRHPIDADRIYATGMSNGGFMSYRLACELSDRIAAIAPVAASMSLAECIPERPVPVIHFHSYHDESVPPSGGIGNGPSGHYNAPTDSVLNAWASLNGCTIPEDTVLSNTEYTRVRWKNCTCGAGIDVYMTEDGGHSWPGGRRTLVGDPVSEYVNASDRMWAFFQLHKLPCEEAPALGSKPENSIKIFPNPSKDRVFVDLPPDLEYASCSVFNTTGRLILHTSEPVLDLSGHPSGVYILSVRSGTKEWTQKIFLE